MALKTKVQKKTAARVEEKKETSSKDTHDFGGMFCGLENVTVPSGIYSLDIVLGGGYEVGDWVEVAGKSCCGKSTMLLELCRKAFKQGKRVAYLDVEYGIKQSFLDNLGIDQSRVGNIAGVSDFLLLSPQTFLDMQTVFNIIVAGNPKCRYDIIIVDSMSNVKQYCEDLSIEDTETMRRARQEGLFYSMFKPKTRDARTTVFVISQIGIDMKKVGNQTVVGEKAIGGLKAGHNFDIRLKMEKKKSLVRKETTIHGHHNSAVAEDDSKTSYGCISHLWAEKNRGERPYVAVETAIIYGQGVSNPHFLMTSLLHLKICKPTSLKKNSYGKTEGKGWKFGEIPELPFLSGKEGEDEYKLLMILKEHSTEVVDYLKSIDKWRLTSGVNEEVSFMGGE